SCPCPRAVGGARARSTAGARRSPDGHSRHPACVEAGPAASAKTSRARTCRRGRQNRRMIQGVERMFGDSIRGPAARRSARRVPKDFHKSPNVATGRKCGLTLPPIGRGWDRSREGSAMNVPTPPRSLKIGTIIDKTLGVLELNVRPVLLFIAGLTLANGAITYFTRDMTRATDALVLAIAAFAIGIVASYLLLSAAVRRTGLGSRTADDTFLPYCLMSILAILGILGGLILLILPGLVIMARWMLAGTL